MSPFIMSAFLYVLFRHGNTCLPQGLPQGRNAVVKHRTGHTAEARSLHVGRRIIHKKAFLRVQGEFFEQQPVNFRLGLYQLHVGRDEGAVKKFATRDQRPIIVLPVAGVGEEIQACLLYTSPSPRD